MTRRPPGSRLFPYTTLFRSRPHGDRGEDQRARQSRRVGQQVMDGDRSVRALDAQPGEVFADGAVEVEPAFLAELEDGERSEEHTSELQSHVNLVCRLLLEKK